MLIYYIYIFISPILLLLLYISSFFNFKIKNNLFFYKSILNNHKEKIKSNTKPVLLFHAASAGEFEQLKPVLKRIDRDKYFIIQSFTSSTIYDKSNVWKSYVDIGCYQPFDILFRASKYFFNFIKPKCYIITRHDIWPKYIVEAKKQGIPIIIINANIHKNSLWNKQLLKSFSLFIFNKIDHFLVPSERIKNNLTKISNCLNVSIISDTRFAQIIDRALKNKNIQLPELTILLDSSNIIFGSIDENDEKIIFKGLKATYPNGEKDLLKQKQKLIFVPHEIHPKIITRLCSQVESLGMKATLYNSKQKKQSISEANVIIIVEVGILAELYRYSQLAYIGGGFSRGVHSVIEPGIYNNLIACGPNIEMLDEAKEMLSHNLLTQIDNVQDLSNFFALLNNKNQSNQSSKAFILQKQSSINKIINLIDETV